ncbi:DUF1684 domain-containing protein [Nocardioides antri]|uniref:DUF1684 domain-containing protein n=1 Tax=Nocardioides antri TaxID=2607659 RepID=A0A5B1M6I2_9ACTN|nr:DUF1684 domain-containing protein [Nocardioides antri]KAA1427300.1 DUF1684 domain-containing protein [Nocardioides antri]
MGDDFLGEWHAWRRRREERLTAPDGFLAITGLHWLGATPQRCAPAPGAWSVGADGVVVELDPEESLVLDDREIRGRHVVGPVDEVGVRARSGDVVVEVASRGDAVLLRPRDPANPLRTRHRATPTYPPSPDWVVTAQFSPFEGDRPTDDAVGEVTFTIADEQVRLVAYDDEGGLWLVFADGTSGRTTYPAGRQLVAPAPAADGTVVLDFNRTTNLPCAYTELTTCPVPLPQNRLTVPIEAGEQDPASVPAAQD